MQPRLLLLFVCLGMIGSLWAQNARSINGTGNNLNNPTWGAVNDAMATMIPVDFADGMGAPGGVNRPNPRIISNELFRQDSILPDAMHLSDFCWVFGQFIDHDLTLTLDNHDEQLIIQVPSGDAWFDPMGRGQAIIPMLRTAIVPGTGTSADNPRKFFNAITSFLDGSAVYGSDQHRADWLRTFAGGKMKTSAGNLMPYNTITGEFDSDIDPNAPEMGNATGVHQKFFVAGDVRANENPLLISFHTLFVREHNRIADELRLLHPNWRDEQLYQGARKRVGAIIQAIVYEEWLPTMGVKLAPYQGYDPNINPAIFNVFSAAAFRMGHTLLNGRIIRMDNEGNILPQGNLMLRDAFFNPAAIEDVGGIEPYFKGMGVQTQQSFDAKVLDDVRNFLFGPPGAGGLDLASININRGRERGLADYNSIRESFGLPRKATFLDINSNQQIATTLENLYGSVDNIDAWVGMLSEDRMDKALFGELVMKIMEDQFTVLRDGDRYYYENDPSMTPAERETIKNTRLYHVLMRNTSLEVMQQNVFQAMPHNEICTASEDFADLNGNVKTHYGQLVPDVTINAYAVSSTDTISNLAADGNFQLVDLATCEDYTLRPTKGGSAVNGVSTIDLVLISRHILNVKRLDSPYKILAADINNSGTVSTLDIVGIRKVILRVSSEFPNQQSWGFVPANFTFPNPEEPWQTNVPISTTVNKFNGRENVEFIAFKYGDVNEDVRLDDLQSIDNRTETLAISVTDQALKAGTIVEIPLLANAQDLAGLQFTLSFNPDVIEILDLNSSKLGNLDFSNYAIFDSEGIATFSWNGSFENTASDALLSLVVQVKRDAQLKDALELNSDLTAALAIDEALNIRPLSWNAGNQLVYESSGQAFAIGQNFPNPFTESTVIGVTMPEAGMAQIEIFDLSGKLVYSDNQYFESGQNTFEISSSNLPLSGVYTYKVRTPFGSAVKKLICTQ